MMAQIKTALQDIEYFDHDFTPTFVNANSFTVPGDQTTRLVSGRKLKLFDATTVYRSIATASFTTVTTISLGAGTAITSSLSSFAIATLNSTNQSFPDKVSVSAVEITGTLSVSGNVAIIGAIRCDSTLSISGTVTIPTPNANVLCGTVTNFPGSTGGNIPGVMIENLGSLFASRPDGPVTATFNKGSVTGALVSLRYSAVEVGSIAVTTTSATYNTVSDLRLKTNIQKAPEAGLDLDNIEVVSFDWKKTNTHTKYGLIAQQLYGVCPAAVNIGNLEEEMWSISYSKLIPMLVREIQSLRKRVSDLESST